MFALGSSRKRCNKRSCRPKKKACPPEIRGIKGNLLRPTAPQTSSSRSFLLLCWMYLLWSIVHFCLPFLPKKEEVGLVSDCHDNLPSPSTFHLGLPRKALTSRRRHVETDLNLFKDEIGNPPPRRRVLEVMSSMPLPPHMAVF